MKLKSVWIVFVVAMFLLFTLQSVWLYNMYIEKKIAIQEELNLIFEKAVESELSNRFIYSSEFVDSNPEKYKNFSYTQAHETSDLIENGLMSVQYLEDQKFLYSLNIPLNMTVLDSIYTSMLSKEDLLTPYTINHKDSLGNIIESKGANLTEGFETNPLPIINKEEVQVIASLPLPFIFKEMIGFLLISFFLLALIMDCLLYELKVIFTQRRLNQLREDFSHALIHEMKTPLSTIYMAIDQLERGHLDNTPELRSKFCNTAMSQVLSLQALSDKILTIARLEENTLTLEKKTVNLPALLQQLVDKFSVQTKKEVRFTLNTNLEDEEVQADPVYLSNAVSNLIDNAIKYSNSSVAIEIDCRMDNNKLLIEVRDTGFGISSKDQETIFEKFERGAAVGRKGAKGFGLGLNYVKRVMEAHGGTVSLSSIEGQGSIFILYMPKDIRVS
jgi:two-component system phosphate regulon sensor histidine kinase PhoR